MSILVVITAIIIVIWICIAIYNAYSYFLKSVSHSPYEIGTFKKPFSQSKHNDYVVFAKYSSRGSFVTGRKIHLDMKLVFSETCSPDVKNEIKKSKLIVILSGSSPLKEESSTVVAGFQVPVSNFLELNFIDDTTATGATDFLYKNTGQFGYLLIINNVPQQPQNYQRVNPVIQIGEHPRLDIVMLYVSVIAILVSILQILLQLAK